MGDAASYFHYWNPGCDVRVVTGERDRWFLETLDVIQRSRETMHEEELRPVGEVIVY